jgi:hypothetical protein
MPSSYLKNESYKFDYNYNNTERKLRQYILDTIKPLEKIDN